MTAESPSGRMVAAFTALKVRLEATDLSFTTASYRDDAMSFLVNEPGHYWEIDVLEDGSIDVEIFRSNGLEGDPWAALEDLLRRNRSELPEEGNT